MMFSGKKLHDLRGEMPRPQLAEKLQCSVKTIYNWEVERTVPNANDLAHLVAVLSVPFLFFYEDEECPESSETQE